VGFDGGQTKALFLPQKNAPNSQAISGVEGGFELNLEDHCFYQADHPEENGIDLKYLIEAKAS